LRVLLQQQILLGAEPRERSGICWPTPELGKQLGHTPAPIE